MPRNQFSTAESVIYSLYYSTFFEFIYTYIQAQSTRQFMQSTTRTPRSTARCPALFIYTNNRASHIISTILLTITYFTFLKKPKYIFFNINLFLVVPKRSYGVDASNGSNQFCCKLIGIAKFTKFSSV
jgi:hypothetical protein